MESHGSQKKTSTGGGLPVFKSTCIPFLMFDWSRLNLEVKKLNFLYQSHRKISFFFTSSREMNKLQPLFFL
jgi:hypothetical protein